ncbi:cytochrome P450 76C2-like isoform X2 [Prosopis cineraria]|nr:cytochrome P450 76C2-like isoform X2 [Prosopis cineraria]XP_054782336.1 cytochrome P450 76C2-like isoform X2 [Prosopis cineraria]
MRGYYKKFYKLVDDIWEETLHLRGSNIVSKENNDALDSILDLIEDDSSQFSCGDVIYLFIDLFVAGTDTTPSKLEWTMAELIRNPEKMVNVRTKLQHVLGNKNNTLNLEETMSSKLTYLQAIQKETLHLHPPVPYLLPCKAICDVELCGFLVPKNAQIFVNVWAMGRDPTIWDKPNSFIPKRFLESEIDFKANDFKFIPFGVGRRMCPGLPLASRVLPFMLASLTYHFDWKVPDGLKLEDMDMSQNYGILLHKAQPLRAVPVKM